MQRAVFSGDAGPCSAEGGSPAWCLLRWEPPAEVTGSWTTPEPSGHRVAPPGVWEQSQLRARPQSPGTRLPTLNSALDASLSKAVPQQAPGVPVPATRGPWAAPPPACFASRIGTGLQLFQAKPHTRNLLEQTR